MGALTNRPLRAQARLQEGGPGVCSQPLSEPRHCCRSRHQSPRQRRREIMLMPDTLGSKWEGGWGGFCCHPKHKQKQIIGHTLTCGKIGLRKRARERERETQREGERAFMFSSLSLSLSSSCSRAKSSASRDPLLIFKLDQFGETRAVVFFLAQTVYYFLLMCGKKEIAK